MNDDQARFVRIYQYLLSKDVILKDYIIEARRRLQKKNIKIDDVYYLYYNLLRLEIWEEFSGDIWKLLK